MTTCSTAQAAITASSGRPWEGTYIDWQAVDAFLLRQKQQLPAPGAATVQAATNAEQILSSLEMMYGQDLLATLPGLPQSAFTATDVLDLLETIVRAQTFVSAADQVTNLTDSIVPSGGAGWWSPGDHHLAITANMYLALRRNTTGLDLLAATRGVVPQPIEHKILPWGWSFPGSGGLVDMQSWAAELFAAQAFPAVPPGCFGGGTPSNFWGELIGLVCLYQGMIDLSATLHPGVSPLDPTTPNQPGQVLVSMFDRWAGRQWPGVYPGFNGGCPCEWIVPGSVYPGGNEYWPIEDPAFPGQALATVGQDWDCSLHQLSRAVITLYQVGHSFSQGEQMAILDRLEAWANAACHTSPSALATCPPAPQIQAQGSVGPGVSVLAPGSVPGFAALGYYDAPTETYVAAGGSAPECATPIGVWPGSPPRAPTADSAVQAAVALQRAGTLGPSTSASIRQRAEAVARAVLVSNSALYRVQAGRAGWANFDTEDQGLVPDEDPSLLGTYYALATTFLLSVQGPLLAAPTPGGLPWTSSLVGFLHVFGSSLVVAAPASSWGGGYLPG